jgi:hypothetical protein
MSIRIARLLVLLFHIAMRSSKAHLIWKPCVGCICCTAIPATVGAVTYREVDFLSRHSESDALAKASSGPYQLSHHSEDVVTSGGWEQKIGCSFWLSAVTCGGGRKYVCISSKKQSEIYTHMFNECVQPDRWSSRPRCG